MSINWVMLSTTGPQSFITLPGERALHQSPARTGFSLTTLSTTSSSSNPTTSRSRPISLSSSTGTAYITNQRILYIPNTKTPQLESFACPITNLHDTHVAPPFFGPNVWRALVQPVPNGGLTGQLELKLVFKDGGAFEFSGVYERVKERVLQAVANGVGGAGGVGGEGVHLEELPAYEDQGRDAPPPLPVPVPPRDGAGGVAVVPAPVPSGPPPGYEETQRESVAEELERQIGQIEGARIQ